MLGIRVNTMRAYGAVVAARRKPADDLAGAVLTAAP
jgi:hypothetical protein